MLSGIGIGATAAGASSGVLAGVGVGATAAGASLEAHVSELSVNEIGVTSWVVAIVFCCNIMSCETLTKCPIYL